MGLCISKKAKCKAEKVKGGPTPLLFQTLHGKSQPQPAASLQAETVEKDTRACQQLSHDDAPSNQKKQPRQQHPQTTAAVEPQHQQFLLLGTLAPSPSVSTDSGSYGGTHSPLDPPRAATPLRASSCTKEEVESILIQCGRLSRSSSASTDRQRRKRSHDFEAEGGCLENIQGSGVDGGAPSSSRPSPRRRRARSREKRSESSERGSGGGGRRVSQSPGRRMRSEGILLGAIAASHSPPTGSSCSSSSNTEMPVKMVPVPAREKGLIAPTITIREGHSSGTASGAVTTKATAATSLPVEPGGTYAVPRSASPHSRSTATTATHSSGAPRNESPQSRSVQVVTVPGDGAQASTLSRPARSTSPRSRSPACARPYFDENPQHAPQQTRKVEQQQPRRRYPSPMGEIDGNCIRPERQHKINIPNEQKYAVASCGGDSGSVYVPHRGTKGQAEAETTALDPEAKENTAAAYISPVESIPRSVSTRAAHSRRSSKDQLDVSTTETAAKLSMLLEDIQNYHQKQQQQHPQINSTTPMPAALDLPTCVAKTRSILDAVTDLDPLDAMSESCDGFSSNWNAGFIGPSCHGRGARLADPGATATADFLWDPSSRRYVSVRGGAGGKLAIVAAAEDVEPQESAGSNSFVWGPEWEPGSADNSTGHCWASASPSCSVERGEEMDGSRAPLPLPSRSPPALGLPRQPFLAVRADEIDGVGFFRGATGNGRGRRDSLIARVAVGGSTVSRAASGSKYTETSY